MLIDNIVKSVGEGRKLFAVLIDPEKTFGTRLSDFLMLVEEAKPDMILVGGSQLQESVDSVVLQIKSQTDIPVVLFIGNTLQFTPNADAMLYLSLISGRNAEFLIGQHTKNSIEVKQSGVETIPTGYILVGGGVTTAVERVSGTTSLSDIEAIVRTAVAGELLGEKLMYLEAGSGASVPVSKDMISEVKSNVSLPLIVGGGINSLQGITDAIEAGADIVVVGNHLEQYPNHIFTFAQHIRSLSSNVG